jgi:hypothetical protein
MGEKDLKNVCDRSNVQDVVKHLYEIHSTKEGCSLYIVSSSLGEVVNKYPEADNITLLATTDKELSKEWFGKLVIL